MNKHIKFLTIFLASIFLVIFSTKVYAQAVQLIPAQVVKIIKGDTIMVTITGRQEEVRLLGIDIPQPKYLGKTHFHGIEAYDYLNSFLDNRTVFLEFDVEKIDRQGRLLAYVWLEQPITDSEREKRTKMLNAQLFLKGYGPLLLHQPNTKYLTSFQHYQNEAKENKLCYWQ